MSEHTPPCRPLPQTPIPGAPTPLRLQLKKVGARALVGRGVPPSIPPGSGHGVRFRQGLRLRRVSLHPRKALNPVIEGNQKRRVKSMVQSMRCAHRALDLTLLFDKKQIRGLRPRKLKSRSQFPVTEEKVAPPP